MKAFMRILYQIYNQTNIVFMLYLFQIDQIYFLMSIKNLVINFNLNESQSIHTFKFQAQLQYQIYIMLGLRKTATFISEQVKNSESKFLRIVKIILPPFIIYAVIYVFVKVKGILGKIKNIGNGDKIEEGQISKEFHRRRFQQHLERLKLTQEQLGFTNQVLYQESKKSINYYLPVFITNKIKSIQDVSVQNLTGNISCALIINVCFEGLPQEIIKKLESSIIIQLNRGQAIKLEDDGITITVKRQKNSKFLIFTVRKLFLAFLLQDTLWSPFELIELILSITLNTVSIPSHSLQKINEKSEYCPEKQYKISFNCMRNSDLIPISYALDCVFGVYDLAQRKLQSYHTRYGTISQIQKAYEEYLAREQRKKKESKELEKQEKKQKESNTLEVQEAKKNKEQPKDKAKQEKSEKKPAEKTQKKEQQFSLLEILAQSTMRRLSLRPSNQKAKKPPPKVKYFQYTHFVIPLYKYPGNSLATIFIPIFLLALVSLAIFFQQPQLSGRIGAIATMILGYIALIPSIKEQLPPSSKLTVIETVVYIQTMCCLLCLYQSFTIDGQEQYRFIWYENYTFLLCLLTHISTFFFIIGIYIIHKLKWEPDYNCDEKVIEIKPGDNRSAWDNPYCDEVFLKFNKSIKTGRYTETERENLYIRPLKERNTSQEKSVPKDKEQKKHDKQQTKGKQEKPFNIFDKLLGFALPQKENQQTTAPAKIQMMSKEVEDQFSTPDPSLYYKNGQKMKQI